MSNHPIGFFREAAPYIHKYRGKTFVLAFAGEVIEDIAFSKLIEDIAIISALGARIVIVHGARAQVDQHLRTLNHSIEVVNDLRVTDDLALQTAKKTIGALRVEIENKLSHALSRPPVINESLGVLSGNFITAQPLGILDGTDFQYTGSVRKINTTLITQLLESGSIVLLSPLGTSPSGETYNLRYEDIASFAAKSLHADKLIFIHAEAATPTVDIELQHIDLFIDTHPQQKHLLSLQPKKS